MGVIVLPLTIDTIESATCFFMSLPALGGMLVNYFLHITWADDVVTAMILGFVALEIKGSLEEIREEGNHPTQINRQKYQP